LGVGGGSRGSGIEAWGFGLGVAAEEYVGTRAGPGSAADASSDAGVPALSELGFRSAQLQDAFEVLFVDGLHGEAGAFLGHPHAL
jgi:hypothetical protein